MKKIKISELPIYNSLRGLFTIGTDSNNRSVKVSLEFIEDKTNEAVENAENATSAANNAASAASEAAASANNAAENANEKAALAQSAATAANTAAGNANTATANAQAATQEAITAKDDCVEATEAAQVATEAARTATTETQTATQEAQEATQNVLYAIGSLLPTALNVDVPKRLTYGNQHEIKIKAILTPANTMRNVIYISDNKAVEVGTDGRITIVAKGKSKVHVIPTCNTSIAKTLLIEVGEPTARLITGSQLRFTQAGAFRFN
jgi:chemotaxis protein histidine kinase CheA